MTVAYRERLAGEVEVRHGFSRPSGHLSRQRRDNDETTTRQRRDNDETTKPSVIQRYPRRILGKRTIRILIQSHQMAI